MTDDSGKQIISAPYIDKGLQNLVVQALGCAVILGCTPYGSSPRAWGGAAKRAAPHRAHLSWVAAEVDKLR